MILVLFAIFSTGCGRDVAPDTLNNVTIAISMQPMVTPIYIAQAQGFFRDQGLNVTLLPGTSGKAALAAVMEGTADVATATETPIMFAGLAGDPVRIIAEIADSNEHISIVSRTESGIRAPEDVAGKTVGVMFGTNADYFLHQFCVFNTIAEDSIQRVDLIPEDMHEALAAKKVDAVVVWNPHGNVIAQALGADAVVLKSPHIYTALCMLAVRSDYTAHHSGTIEKLLRALAEAERFIREHSDKASAIAAENLNLVTIALPEYHFDLALSQVLIVSLEDQSRWAIASKRVARRREVNFRKLIYVDGLKAVAPYAITLLDTR